MKNPKFLICVVFGVLFIGAAIVLRGTGNDPLVYTAVITGVLLLLVSRHIYQDPEYYMDDDEYDDDEYED